MPRQWLLGKWSQCSPQKSRGKEEQARHKLQVESLATIPDEVLEALDKQTNDFKKAEKGTSLGHTTTYFVSRLEQ